MGKWQQLPAMQKQEVIDFIEFLAQKNPLQNPRRSLKGALAHLNIHFTVDDLNEARREMWRGYMGEDA